MTKEQYLSVKAELKELGKIIRELKNGFREDQKTFSKYQSEHGTFNDYYEGRMNSTIWETIQPEYSKLNQKQYGSMITLQETQFDYRHLHIVYSFARGKTMSQIEPKTRKGNKPHRDVLQRLMKVYDVHEPLVLEAAS